MKFIQNFIQEIRSLYNIEQLALKLSHELSSIEQSLRALGFKGKRIHLTNYLKYDKLPDECFIFRLEPRTFDGVLKILTDLKLSKIEKNV